MGSFGGTPNTHLQFGTWGPGFHATFTTGPLSTRGVNGEVINGGTQFGSRHSELGLRFTSTGSGAMLASRYEFSGGAQLRFTNIISPHDHDYWDSGPGAAFDFWTPIYVWVEQTPNTGLLGDLPGNQGGQNIHPPGATGAETEFTLEQLDAAGNPRWLLAGQRTLTAAPVTGVDFIIPLDLTGLVLAAQHPLWDGTFNIVVNAEDFDYTSNSFISPSNPSPAAGSPDLVRFTATSQVFLETGTALPDRPRTGQGGGAGGRQNSRSDLCPICGFMSLRETWVRQPRRATHAAGQLVCPRCLDEAEPEPRRYSGREGDTGP